MGGLEIVLIGIALAMDATAVSITCGSTLIARRLLNAIKIALFFGFFQGFMPVIGWYAGVALRDIITELDHWIAFALLVFIGGKMIYDSTRHDSDHDRCLRLTYPVLFTLAIATSIDALAVGVGFAFLNISILFPVIMIGIITAVLSFMAFFAGNGLAKILGNKVEIAGGIILIGIGTKILIEHTFF